MRRDESRRVRVLVLLASIALAVPLLSAALAGANAVTCAQVFLDPADPVHVDVPPSPAGCEATSINGGAHVAGVQVCGTGAGTPPGNSIVIGPPTTIHVTVTEAGQTVWVDGEGDAISMRGHAAVGVNGTANAHAGVADDVTGVCP